jgi:hypothetical protein
MTHLSHARTGIVSQSQDEKAPIEIEQARAAIRNGIERARALVDEYERVILPDRALADLDAG